MPYPSRLVPTLNDNLIQQVPSNDTLCRWSRPGLQLRDSEGRLSAEAIDEKRVFNYSVNKLPPSLIDDIYIEFKDNDKFNAAWVVGTDGYFPKEHEYKYVPERGIFLFKVKDIEYSTTYPYPANLQPNNFRFIVQVVHRPLIANIAHFELSFSFFTLDGFPANPLPGGGSRKIIAAELRQKLIKISKFTEAEFNEKV